MSAPASRTLGPPRMARPADFEIPELPFIPSGWTTDASVLDYGLWWASDKCSGQLNATWAGLGKAIPIMCHEDGDTVMFMAGDTFYLWLPISWAISEITASRDLEKIVELLEDGGVENGILLLRAKQIY